MRKFLQFTLSLLAMLMVTLNASAWKFLLLSPTEGVVTTLDEIKIQAPGAVAEWTAVPIPVKKDGAEFKNWNMADDWSFTNTIVGRSVDYVAAEDPGTYTMEIPAGAYHIGEEANEAQTFTWTIKSSDDQGGGTQGGGEQGGGSATSGWTFTSVTPTEGVVDDLSTIVFEMPQSVGGANESANLNIVDQNGTTYKYMLYDNYGGSIYAAYVGEEGNEPSKAGTYTLTIPAATFTSFMDGATNAEMTYTWTIKGEDAPAQKDYTITYDAAAGTVYVTWPQGTTLAATDFSGMMHPTIEGYAGSASGGSFNAPNVIEVWASLAPGDYTLKFPAGDFTVNNVPNAEFSETFTVGGGSQGGGTFEGTPWHENVFKAGETTVDKNNIAFNTNGVEITTVDGEFNLGGTTTKIPFGYNTYDEKELDWNNKCKFVITAKEDINKVIFVPCASAKTAIANATADKGSYSNGVWEGKLAAGETLTLTASDGIQVKEIYVCYNGDEFDPTSQEDEKGVITIQYPVENQLIEKQVDGGKFCVFTTNKEYAQVTIEVKNSNEAYDNLFKFPTRMVDNMGEKSDNLHVGENTIYAATPASGSAGKGDDWYWFKGDSYTMIVKGYVNPWDTEYDAIAEVHFVGNGKEHVAESIVKLLNITPATSFDSFGKIAMVNGVITLEFDGPVTSVKAITPGGMSDPTINHTATAKAGSDNKVWEINLGDRSGFASADTDGNPIIEVDVTATAADGIVLLSDTRADRGLELKYELVANAGPTNPVTLGDPTWSVAEGAEIEASTSSINIKFPNATNVEGTYTLEVSGTLGDKSFNIVNVSGTGTMANGVDIPVTLAEDKSYNLLIGSITIKNGNDVVYTTTSGNYQVNFGTTTAQGGSEEGVTVEAESISEGALFVKVNGILSIINELTADHYLNIGNVTVDGETDLYQLGMVFGGEISGAQRITSWNALADGNHTVTIPAGELEIAYWPFTDPTGTTLYKNNEDIVITFAVENGVLTEAGDDPSDKPTSVVLYDYAAGDRTTLNDKTRSITKDGVTLTATGSNAYTVPAEGGNFAGLRVGKYVTLTVSAEQEIEKIEFTTTGTVWSDDVTDLNGGSFSNATWTGSANSVTFKTPNDQTISKIVVYFKQENPQPESILGEPTVSIENNTLKIEFDAPENVEGASLATTGVKISVDGVDYYGNADEAFAENGKIVVEVPLSSTMEMVNFDSYSPQVGDELSITIIEPEVYANYADGNWEKVWEGDDITCSHTISTTSGINNIAAGSANDKMYNLAGQQIKVAKGIVIKNGKKMFVK